MIRKGERPIQYGLIGEHLGHSFSKIVHAYLAEYDYELCELTPDEVDAFMMRRDFCAINVTIPYKGKVIPHLSYIDPQAEAIGAVNTIVNRDGKLYGYNTDFYGMSALIRKLGIDPRGKKVAVLGTGGTSKTAMAVAQAMGAREILKVSRTAKDGAIDYATLNAEHTDTEIVINTTPCGMYPNPDAAPICVRDFPSLEGVVDAIYNPLRPKLVLEAQAMGIPAEGGLYMLIAQAVRACEIFLDKTYPADTSDRIYRDILAQKENIVLVGMPACGKSTVGAILSGTLKREVLDLDACIVKFAGKSIPEIFAESGESGFRDLETQVLEAELAQRNGIVIATGGGAILRDRNVEALRRNGRLYFIDRPLADLLPTEDRPLASSAEAIKKRFEERYHRYCAVADMRVEVRGTAESVAEAIRKDFFAQ